jgi:hypothetical protein
MCDILQTRANAGKPSVITYKGKQVDLNKLRRFKKEDARQQAKMRAASTSIEGEPLPHIQSLQRTTGCTKLYQDTRSYR